MSKIRILSSIGFLVLAAGFAQSQDYPPSGYVFHPNQEVRISDLPVRTRQTTEETATLLTALETVFRDPDVCCGKNSSLEDAVQSVKPLSLKELSGKLQGKHVLGDGSSIFVAAEYRLPSELNSITPDEIIAALKNNQPMLMEWDSQLYVVHGVVFNEYLYYSGRHDWTILKLLLLDTRFADERRNVSFERPRDNWMKVQGLLMLRMTKIN